MDDLPHRLAAAAALPACCDMHRELRQQEMDPLLDELNATQEAAHDCDA